MRTRRNSWTGYILARFAYQLMTFILVVCQKVPFTGTENIISVIHPEHTFWSDSTHGQGEISKFVLGANHLPWSGLSVFLCPAKRGGNLPMPYGIK
jgi:hypothetical protein